MNLDDFTYFPSLFFFQLDARNDFYYKIVKLK